MGHAMRTALTSDGVGLKLIMTISAACHLDLSQPTLDSASRFAHDLDRCGHSGRVHGASPRSIVLTWVNDAQERIG
jgi:hypothetical protein